MNPPPRPPLTEGQARPPRPGLAKALGVGHVVTATLSSLVLAVSVAWVVIAASAMSGDRGSSAMMGMDEPRFLVFTLVDAVTGLILNGLTFASGVGLLNLRAWGARLWRWLAPVKIARLVIVWGGFIVLVAPTLAASMGQSVARIMQQQAPGRTLLQDSAKLSLAYAWMWLAMGVGIIVLGSIYPALTWWLVGRPDVRAALEESGSGSGSTSISDSRSNEEVRLP